MRQGLRGLVTVGCTLFLAACAMGPDYERPEVPVPDGYRAGAVPGESMANLPCGNSSTIRC